MRRRSAEYRSRTTARRVEPGVTGPCGYDVRRASGGTGRCCSTRVTPRRPGRGDGIIDTYSPALRVRREDVVAVLARKCAHVGVAPPDLATIHASPFRTEIEAEWGNMLAHQLPALPPFKQFWNGLEELFGWLEQTVVLPTLARAELGHLDPEWRAPRSMTSWRSGAPIELIRFAGANRLKVAIDYRAEQGRWGPRVVEPYSVRRTLDGNLVLFVVNDRGFLRSYRVDRIAGASVTRDSLSPLFRGVLTHCSRPVEPGGSGSRPVVLEAAGSNRIVECLTTNYPPAYLGRTGAYWVYAVDWSADRTAGQGTGAHSIDNRERTLNPRVQGSSPWGRTHKGARSGRCSVRLRPDFRPFARLSARLSESA